MIDICVQEGSRQGFVENLANSLLFTVSFTWFSRLSYPSLFKRKHKQNQ